MKEESLLLLSDLQKLINQVVLIDYTIIILGGESLKYEVIRTDTADSLIRKIILHVAENFGDYVALEKLDYLEEAIMNLGDNPYIGVKPKYNVLKRQWYLVLILEKYIVFYKVDDNKKQIIVYAVVDQRQDYLSIIRGL